VTDTPQSAVTAASASPIAAPDTRSNLGLGIAAGLVATLIGAVLWAVITVTTEFQIGFMAIGVGVLVGFAVRRFGNGTAQAFGIAGGALSLLGCVIGNLFTVIGFISNQESMPLTQVAGIVLADPSMTVMLMRESFSAMDILFYAIAVYEGYKLAFRPAASVQAA
jgi:hypothetical protein